MIKDHKSSLAMQLLHFHVSLPSKDEIYDLIDDITFPRRSKTILLFSSKQILGFYGSHWQTSSVAFNREQKVLFDTIVKQIFVWEDKEHIFWKKLKWSHKWIGMLFFLLLIQQLLKMVIINKYVTISYSSPKNSYQIAARCFQWLYKQTI